jgi:hypothetical protein
VGRAEEIPNAGNFMVRKIGNQSLIIYASITASMFVVGHPD